MASGYSRGDKGVDRIGCALFDACVDLNPHQIEATLLALRSPLLKVLLLTERETLFISRYAGR